MARLQRVVIAVVVLIGSGFIWLHEHDKRVKAEALNEQRYDELKTADAQIDGLRESLVLINKKYMEDTKRYKDREKVLGDSLKKIDVTVDDLLGQIEKMLPDSSKHLVADVEEACKSRSDLIYTQLVICEGLRQQALAQIGQRDTIIWRLQSTRDGYKQLYESQLKIGNRGGIWATVGKGATGFAVLTGLAKLLHLF